MQVLMTNIMSMSSLRNLGGADQLSQASLGRLSSGLRINQAKDDAAGLAVSTRFTAQIQGLNQAVRNANDGLSLAQTASNALEEVQESLVRMRSLLIQSANGTQSQSDRSAIGSEVIELQNEIVRQSEVVEFNGVRVVNSSTEIGFYVAARDDATSTTSIIRVRAVNLLHSATGIGSALGAAVNAFTADDSRDGLAIIDRALNRVSDMRGEFGNVMGRFESVVNSLYNISDNATASRSRVMDADYASESASYARATILRQTGIAMLSQANVSQQVTLSLLS
jgi:flagellin